MTLTVEQSLVILGFFTAAAYVLVGLIAGLWPSMWDDSGATEQIFWIVFLVGGGLLILAGLRRSRRSPWLAAALISIGAVAGALPLFWTVLAILLAIALIVLSVVYARRVAGAAPAAD